MSLPEPEPAEAPHPAPAAADVLKVTDAVFAYRGRPALRGLGLTVRPGEVYALLGPNGAGKTTAVRAICGRIRLDAGKVSVLGLDPARDRRARALVGFVPQEIALYPRLTGRENLHAFARLLGVPRRRRGAAVEAAMRVTQAAERAQEPVAGLSGGWRRRFNIAAGILHAPRLLVLDEPTVGVDLDAKLAIQSAVGSLRGGGTAILLVTHDLQQAADLADRIGIMISGRLHAEGAPADLLCATFGAARRACFTLACPPSPREQARLAQEGLLWSEAEAELSMPQVADYAVAAAVAERLAAEGQEVSGISIREPSLADLLSRCVAETRPGAP